jgi:phosphoglucosamine mutase
MRCDAGVVISASHNPYQDNGIKLFARDGFKLADEVEASIEALMASERLDERRAGAEWVGHANRIEDAAGRYVVFCKHTFPADLTLDGVKIVVDCGHGAAYRVAPMVLEELGARVIPLNVKPNGKNINESSGALHPDAMCTRVALEGADLGLALDGDADRAVLCDARGNVVDGDAIMALCATRVLRAGRLAEGTLVATVMSNIGLERAMAAAGGRVVRAPVGDRYVVEEMRRGGYNFGGEQSGHLVFLDHNTTGDGIVAGLHVLSIMVREQRPLAELAGVMERVPQVLVNVRVARRRPLEELPEVTAMIGAVEARLGADGRVLVRYSGTEPKARVMIEGPDEARIQADAEAIAAAIERGCAA